MDSSEKLHEITEGKIWNVGDIILNDHKVVGVLGRGGMGVVYLVVRSQSTGEQFAVKKLLIGEDGTRRNFLLEFILAKPGVGMTAAVCLSFPCKRESMLPLPHTERWIPAFAGMTVVSLSRV